MASAPSDDLTPIINTVLNRARLDFGVTNDKDLGKALGASNAAIYFWRNGDVGKSARILIPLILQHYQEPKKRTPIRYRRRGKTDLLTTK